MKTQEFIDMDLVSSTPPLHGVSSGIRKPLLHVSPSQAEIESRDAETQQQILELGRQLEEAKKVHQELEDLRRRHEEFESGKTEMLEELARTVIQPIM